MSFSSHQLTVLASAIRRDSPEGASTDAAVATLVAQLDAAADRASSGTITASGSTIADAELLLYGTNNVTGADGTKGVKTNAGIVPQIVVNSSATYSLYVYPSSASKTISGADNAGDPVIVDAGTNATFIEI